MKWMMVRICSDLSTHNPAQTAIKTTIKYVDQNISLPAMLQNFSVFPIIHLDRDGIYLNTVKSKAGQSAIRTSIPDIKPANWSRESQTVNTPKLSKVHLQLLCTLPNNVLNVSESTLWSAVNGPLYPYHTPSRIILNVLTTAIES